MFAEFDMKVFELMTVDVGFCRTGDDLARAAYIMWQRDCGVVPIVGDDGRVIGVVTDRDIAIAAASQNRRPSEMRCGEMVARSVACCLLDESIADVLERMAKLRVRRLPVIGARHELAGIISLTDIIRKGGKKDSKRAMKALAKILGPADRAEPECVPADEVAETEAAE